MKEEITEEDMVEFSEHPMLQGYIRKLHEGDHHLHEIKKNTLENVKLAVQINGKTRLVTSMKVDMEENKITEVSFEHPNCTRCTTG